MQSNFTLLAFSLLMVTTALFGCKQTKSASNQNIENEQTNDLELVDFSEYGINPESNNWLEIFKIGDEAPDFSGTDQFGDSFNLEETLQTKEVLLIFYRGYWCPYCTKYLASFVDHLQTFDDKGVQIVAVAPEMEEYISQTREKTKLDIPFIHDEGHEIMDKYNVTFMVTEEYQNKFEGWKGMTINDVNHGHDEPTLPVPATYLIGQDRTIKWVHFDPNYKNRPTVEEILEQL